MKTKQATMKISDIKIDGGTQQRESINTEIVEEYAEAQHAHRDLHPARAAGIEALGARDGPARRDAAQTPAPRGP